MNIGINVSLNHISGERLMDLEGGISNIQVTTNISVTKMTQVHGMLEVGFVFVVNYSPAIANLTLKGVARITGNEKDMGEIKKNFDEKKAVPPMVLQSISNISFIEGIFLARSLNIPPPIPLPSIQQQDATKGRSPSYIG